MADQQQDVSDLEGGGALEQQPKASSVERQYDVDETYNSAMQSSLNDLIPWCGLGIITLFIDPRWPACFGCSMGFDCLCCSNEVEYCRFLCAEGGDDCCGRTGNCNLMQQERSGSSHTRLKSAPNDWCNCYHENCTFGECKTLIALKTSCCCCEQRCGIPTNSIKSIPWLWNCFGLTVWYQWSCPMMACCVTVLDLKEQTAGSSIPDCCMNNCPTYFTSESEVTVVSKQPQAIPSESAAVDVTTTAN